MPVDITWTTLRNDAAARKLIWLARCQWSVDDNGELELSLGKARGQIEADQRPRHQKPDPPLQKAQGWASLRVSMGFGCVDLCDLSMEELKT